MYKRFLAVLVVITVLIYQFVCLTEAKQFHFKYYSFRRKQRHARKYKVREEDCEAHSCATIEGLEKTKCTRKCVSQQCYKELYTWDECVERDTRGLYQMQSTDTCRQKAFITLSAPASLSLEEGEIDVRLNSFKGCYMKELQEMEMKGLL